jgi:hypothetical protein
MDKIRSRHRKMHSSKFNASLIEYRSFNNESGHGLDSHVEPVCHSYTGCLCVSDNWCHACELLVDYDLAVKLNIVFIQIGWGEDGVGPILQ